MDTLLEKAVGSPRALSRTELVRLLEWPDAGELFAAAYAVKIREIGRSVSNLCIKRLIYFLNGVSWICNYQGIYIFKKIPKFRCGIFIEKCFA